MLNVVNEQTVLYLSFFPPVQINSDNCLRFRFMLHSYTVTIFIVLITGLLKLKLAVKNRENLLSVCMYIRMRDPL